VTTPTVTAASVAILTEQYRQAQVELGARTIRDAIALWRLLAENPERNQPTWLTFMLELVRRDRQQAARYAVDYVGAYRRMVGARTPFTPVLPPIEIDKIVTSLQVTGPVALQKKIVQLREQQPAPAVEPRISPASKMARDLASASARAAQRHVVNAGREVIEDTIQRDREVRGYVRITDGDPCFFCAVLASRGAVYTDESFDDSDPRFEGPGNHKVHDGCACSLIPIYTPRSSDKTNPLLDRSREFEQLWITSGGNGKQSGRAALLEFRRAYEGREKYRV
jgi:hypothetical protein